MKRWLWIALMLAIVLVIVVATFPARLALSGVLAQESTIRLEGVAGTVWNGSAARVLHRDEDQGRLHWRLRAMPLLLGRIIANVQLEGPQLRGSARVSRRGELLRVGSARLEIPARHLESLLDIPALHPTGTLHLELHELELQGRVPMALEGRVIWRDAGMSGAAQADFGTLEASFGALPGGGFGGELRDQGGPLSLEGRFRTTVLGYEAEAHLRARDDDPQVTRALRHIGQIQPDGSVLFRVKGGLG